MAFLAWISAWFRLDSASGFHFARILLDLVRFGWISVGFCWIWFDFGLISA